MNQQAIQLSLTIDEINLILVNLNKLPRRVSNNVCVKIEQQATAHLSAQEAAEQERMTKEILAKELYKQELAKDAIGKEEEVGHAVDIPEERPNSD